MKHILSLIIALVMLSGCVEPTPDRRLLRAEGLIGSLPDSALAILSAIEPSTVDGKRNAALYGLLLTQARHKNYINETDDSLITASLRFFNSEGPEDKEMLAHFYRAAINDFAARYDTALLENLKALGIAKALGDDYWKARTYEQIAGNYYASYNIPMAIQYYDSASVHYKLSGQKLNYLYSQVQLARALGFNKDVDEAIATLDNLDLGEYQSDSVFQGVRHESYVWFYRRKGLYGEARAHLKAALDYFNDKWQTEIHWPEISMMYTNLNQRDSALYFLEKAKSIGVSEHRSGAIEQAEYFYYDAFGDKDKALTALSDAAYEASEFKEKCLESNLVLVEKEFYIEQMLKNQYEAQKTAFIWKVVSLVVIIAGLVALTVVVRKVRRKRRELVILITQKDAFEQSAQEESAKGEELERKLERNSVRIAHLEAELESKDEKASSERVSFEITLKGHLDNEKRWQRNASRLMELRGNLVDALATEVYYMGDKSTEKICQIVKKKIAEFKSDDMRRELEQLVDDCNDGIITRMRAEMPSFKDNHIWFVVLKISGFSMRTICILSDMTIGNYYNYWSRLRARIESSDAPSKQEFIEALRPKGSPE